MSTSSSFTPTTPPSSDSGDVPPPQNARQEGQFQHVDDINVVIEANARLAEGLEHIDVALDNLSEKHEELGFDNTEVSVSGDSSTSSVHSRPDKWHGPRAPELKMPYFNGCLLYTSPSPRDQRGSRMPSSA